MPECAPIAAAIPNFSVIAWKANPARIAVITSTVNDWPVVDERKKYVPR